MPRSLKCNRIIAIMINKCENAGRLNMPRGIRRPFLRPTMTYLFWKVTTTLAFDVAEFCWPSHGGHFDACAVVDCLAGGERDLHRSWSTSYRTVRTVLGGIRTPSRLFHVVCSWIFWETMRDLACWPRINTLISISVDKGAEDWYREPMILPGLLHSSNLAGYTQIGDRRQ